MYRNARHWKLLQDFSIFDMSLCTVVSEKPAASIFISSWLVSEGHCFASVNTLRPSSPPSTVRDSALRPWKLMKRIGNRGAEFTSRLHLPRYSAYATRTMKQCGEWRIQLICTQIYGSSSTERGTDRFMTITTTLIRGVSCGCVDATQKKVFRTDRLPTFPISLWFHQGLPAIL
jgi:hypothetical protein